jgi:hypothetical protein
MQKCLIWVHIIILYDSEILGKHCHYCSTFYEQYNMYNAGSMNVHG